MKLQIDFLGEVDMDNIRKFGDYNPRVFITTVAMLVGLDLRVARRIVLFDPIYSAEMETIATSRICRTNQPAKEIFYYFVTGLAYLKHCREASEASNTSPHAYTRLVLGVFTYFAESLPNWD